MTAPPDLPAARSHARGKEVTVRVLEVARRLLIEEGYAAFTMERVAQEAGVSRTTLYRRWSSKQALVLDSGQVLDPDELTFDDQGSFAADFRYLLEHRLHLSHTGDAATALIASLAASTEEPALRAKFVAGNKAKLQAMEEIIKRGRQRGDIDHRLDASILRLLIAAPPLFSVLMIDDEPDDYFIDRLVELACRAATPEGTVA